MLILKFSFKVLQKDILLSLQWDTFHNDFAVITDFN